jgi:hypothetical protein
MGGWVGQVAAGGGAGDAPDEHDAALRFISMLTVHQSANARSWQMKGATRRRQPVCTHATSQQVLVGRCCRAPLLVRYRHLPRRKLPAQPAIRPAEGLMTYGWWSAK